MLQCKFNPYYLFKSKMNEFAYKIVGRTKMRKLKNYSSYRS